MTLFHLVIFNFTVSCHGQQLQPYNRYTWVGRYGSEIGIPGWAGKEVKEIAGSWILGGGCKILGTPLGNLNNY